MVVDNDHNCPQPGNVSAEKQKRASWAKTACFPLFQLGCTSACGHIRSHLNERIPLNKPFLTLKTLLVPWHACWLSAHSQ